MRTVKPMRLGVLSRPYRWRGIDNLGVSVLAMASMEAAPRLLPDQELWRLAAGEIGAGGVLDLGVPKAVPEVLASGYAYPHGQPERNACGVSLRLASVDKSLLVFGDRYWLDGRASAPQPFEAMRLDWRRAYGGPDFPGNPRGAGRQEERVNGVAVRRLPNIELPHDRFVHPDRPVAAAGFGGLPPDLPQRFARVGTRYGQEWLEQEFPGFADDMDWRFFNAAPDDQWLAGDALPAGAAYEIRNMHPQHERLAGTLPRWRARCFASRDEAGGLDEEIALRLTTAWFFPHCLRVVLIWHGVMAVREDDAADVRHLMPALEEEGAPRSTDHYQAVLKRRLDREQGAVHALRDGDLVPQALCVPAPGESPPDVMARPLARNLRAGRQREYESERERLLAEGRDPALYLAPPPEDDAGIDDLPAVLDRLAEHRQRAERELAQVRGQLRADPQAAALLGEAKPGQANVPGEPGAPPARPALAETLGHIAALGTADGAGAAAADAVPRLQAMARRGYLHAAHLYDAPAALRPLRAARIRRKVEATYAATRDFTGMHLAGGDLAGLDLREACFRGAVLEGADLSNARLDGCDLSEAVLARATLTRASLAGARLHAANLGKAQCLHTGFANADLTEAGLQEAVCEQADWAGASLVRTRMHGTVMRDCRYDGTVFRQLTALDCDFTGARFAHADFDQCVWLECLMDGVSFAGSRLQRCGFVKLRSSRQADFSGAMLEGCSVSGGTSLDGAVFARAAFKDCGLRGTSLRGADFRQARLAGSDLSECLLHEADLQGATATETLFVRADFTGACLRGADLMMAYLGKADLRQADVSRANLFRTDLGQAMLDDSTRTDGAYTRQAKTWPRRRKEAA